VISALTARVVPSILLIVGASVFLPFRKRQTALAAVQADLAEAYEAVMTPAFSRLLRIPQALATTTHTRSPFLRY
jgi:hypothetical protein